MSDGEFLAHYGYAVAQLEFQGDEKKQLIFEAELLEKESVKEL